jgi:geranylgeranyl diphosphate synthase type II
VSDRVQIQIPLHKPIQSNIPADKTHRDRLKEVCRDFVRQRRLVGPLTMEALKQHAMASLEKAGLEASYLEFAAVVLNNEINLSALAKVPYDKRLLLLPRCLRNEKVCKGEFDELGLLCRRCGGCAIDTLTEYAQQLGYSVLVAEGSPVVMGLIEAGGVEAVVGASCLSMLEKVFPYMEAAAFPGVAVPLLYDGCAQTAFDVDWLMEFLEQRDEGESVGLDLRQLRQIVKQWFEAESLGRICGVPAGPVEEEAMEWLSLAGKRWRPALAAGVWTALTRTDVAAMPGMVQKMCVAVECFHKASLIHDDIEDGDEFRYGQKTLHAKSGVPIALNIGDYLIGLGYQLLTELDVDAAVKNRMIAVAAQGHRTLCLGQGAELDWVKKQNALSVENVLRIFEQKTVPAFEVALKLGAILAGADDAMLDVLGRFSRCVGLAYQIHDDLQDWRSGDKRAARLSIFRAMPAEELSEQALKTMLSDFRKQARDCLEEIAAGELKGFLRKVLAKIFDEFEELSCCEDLSPRHP